MSLKIIVLLLGAVLLVQNSNAAPSSAASSEEIGGNIFKVIIERFKLLEITLNELIEIRKLILEKGTIVFKKSLEDPKILAVKTEAMEENVSKLKKLLEQIEKGSESKIFEILDEFGEVINKFSKEKNNNLSEDEEIISNSLKENGIDDLRNSIIEHFKVFMENLKKEMDSYIAGLTAEERKEEAKLLAWYEKLKTETDIEKQFDMFDAFFTETIDSSSESTE